MDLKKKKNSMLPQGTNFSFKDTHMLKVKWDKGIPCKQQVKAGWVYLISHKIEYK